MEGPPEAIDGVGYEMRREEMYYMYQTELMKTCIDLMINSILPLISRSMNGHSHMISLKTHYELP